MRIIHYHAIPFRSRLSYLLLQCRRKPSSVVGEGVLFLLGGVKPIPTRSPGTPGCLETSHPRALLCLSSVAPTELREIAPSPPSLPTPPPYHKSAALRSNVTFLSHHTPHQPIYSPRGSAQPQYGCAAMLHAPTSLIQTRLRITTKKVRYTQFFLFDTPALLW